MANLSIPRIPVIVVLAGVAFTMLVGTTIITLTQRPSPPTPTPLVPDSIARGAVDLPVNHPTIASTVGASFHAKVEQLKKDLSDQPNNLDLILQIATQLRDGHKPAEAVAYYTRYLDANRSNPQPWLDLASCYADLEDWNAAESTMRSMLVVHPGHAEARYNLGAILANRGNVVEAKAIWQQLVEEDGTIAIAEQARQSLVRLTQMAS